MGYSFSLPHSLAYSFVGIQTLYLATNYPAIYWNCACLIVNAGGADLLNTDDIDTDVDDDETTTKKKNKSVNYGKISAAIGESKSKGIIILPPDINESDLIFKPELKRNAIIYGMKGINKVGTQLVYEIFNKRPYKDIIDFLNKVKVNKPQMFSLIKAGAFDELYNGDRYKAMTEYILGVAD
jgi:DNA polymerase-3 subunit alpha